MRPLQRNHKLKPLEKSQVGDQRVVSPLSSKPFNQGHGVSLRVMRGENTNTNGNSIPFGCVCTENRVSNVVRFRNTCFLLSLSCFLPSIISPFSFHHLCFKLKNGGTLPLPIFLHCLLFLYTLLSFCSLPSLHSW